MGTGPERLSVYVELAQRQMKVLRKVFSLIPHRSRKTIQVRPRLSKEADGWPLCATVPQSYQSKQAGLAHPLAVDEDRSFCSEKTRGNVEWARLSGGVGHELRFFFHLSSRL